MRANEPLLACALALLPIGEDPIPAALAQVSAERLLADVETLVGFHNRNSFGPTDSDERGIGAAARWLERELRAISEATGGRLEVRTQRFPVEARSRGGTRAAELVNVYGFLPGTQGDPLGRTYVVSGHYDSINSDRWDAEGFAPGADDDASGTAVVLELARVLSPLELEANLVFLCVSGEEQGLYGSTHFAEVAAADGLAIDGMLTNDIVGGVEGGNGVRDDRTIRCFSDAEGIDSDSRELARVVDEAVEQYVPEADVRLIWRLDRFGRGGDHAPFHEHGVPAVRLTEANEHYARQHQDVREEEGVSYGDVLEHVSPGYMAKVARANAAALARLAFAPAPPGRVRMRAAVRYDTELRWEPSASDGVAGYVVVWRETTSPVWQHASDLVEGTSLTVEGVTADGCFFGVRAVGAGGHASRAVLAEPGPRR